MLMIVISFFLSFHRGSGTEVGMAQATEFFSFVPRRLNQPNGFIHQFPFNLNLIYILFLIHLDYILNYVHANILV